MAENTQRLIEQVLLGEIEVKEAKLKQYQAQINPHFLYNCLNFIQSKASIKDYEGVTAMTLHLASYCRYIHKIEQRDSTLEDELKFVEHYLSMVHMRKREITFDINIPRHIGKYLIPRMILQPLVENCIKHGVEPSMMSGIINLTAEETEQELFIQIKDNGVGMTKERLVAVQKNIEDDYLIKDEAIGTGLRNVNQRLKLYFGKQSRLLVQSHQSQGTVYIIKINKMGENDDTYSIGG
jgi:two-component system sensor histidine kinase YesM